MLIPRPRSRVDGTGSFTLDERTRVTADTVAEPVAQYLQQVLRASTRLPLFGAAGATDVPVIALR
ncbi:hypothetical protein NS263_05615, partial [Curtobacterium oceanosedimentum]